MEERQSQERTFCWKISGELKLFQYQMLQKSKEEIYASAYEIDCMVRIYELLVEKSQSLEKEEFKRLLSIPSLLAFLYSEWLKVEDTQNEEMEHTVCSLLEKRKGREEDEESGVNVKAG